VQWAERIMRKIDRHTRSKQIRFCNWKAVIIYALAVAHGDSYAGATSIVAKLEKHRIILAADARRDRQTLSSGARHDFHDDTCKIVLLSRAAIAIGGNSDYTLYDGEAD